MQTIIFKTNALKSMAMVKKLLLITLNYLHLMDTTTYTWQQPTSRGPGILILFRTHSRPEIGSEPVVMHYLGFAARGLSDAVDEIVDLLYDGEGTAPVRLQLG